MWLKKNMLVHVEWDKKELLLIDNFVSSRFRNWKISSTCRGVNVIVKYLINLFNNLFVSFLYHLIESLVRYVQETPFFRL